MRFVLLASFVAACTGGISKANVSGLEGDSTFVINVLDAPRVLAPGASSGVRVSVNRIKGRTETIGAIRFSAASAPQGVVITGILADNETQGVLSLVTSTTTPPGNYDFTILGTADGRISSAVMSIEISDGGQSDDDGGGGGGPTTPGIPAFTYPTNPAIYTRSVQISPNTPNLASGGPVSGWAITPALPLGLVFDTTTGSISGTPAVISPQTSYQVTAVGTAANTINVVSITVNDVPPSALSYSQQSVSYAVGSAITPNTPNVTGAPITSYSVMPALPGNLTLDTTTGVITGTPIADTPPTVYTVTGTNTGGSVTANLTIATVSAITGLSYATNPANYLRNAPIVANSPSVQGGTATMFSISAPLPSGLSFDNATGIISGTPTVTYSGPAFTITASNNLPSQAQVSLSLSVALDCAGQCVPPAPTGWTGPVAVRTGSGTQSCTGNFPSLSGPSGHTGLNAPPHDCSSVCQAGGSCSLQCYYWLLNKPSTNGTCGGSGGGLGDNRNGCITASAPWHNASQDLSIQGDAPYCRANYGSAGITQATWATDFQACTGSDPSGACAAGGVCKQTTGAPFETKMCIYQLTSGDPSLISCPATGYTSRRIFARDYNDQRNCTDCTCTMSGSPTCTYNIQACSGNCTGCGGPDMQGCYQAGTYSLPKSYNVTITPSGSCTLTSSSTSTGQAVGTNPIVVCCEP